MFRCHFCATCPPPKTKAVRITVEARARTYPARREAHPCEGKLKYQDDPGGTGFEIEREVLACPTCAAREARPLPELTAARPELALGEATRSR